MTMQTWNDVRSQTLQMATSATVFTPEIMKRPRLLILLHGLTGNHAVWPVRTDLQALADKHSLVIALPDGARSFWLDQEVGLKWGKWVGAEFPKLLRATLRVSTAREDTFIGGLSMGGYGAVRAAFDYPQNFAGAISLSGALDVAEEAFRGRHPDLYEVGFGNPLRPRPQDDLVARAAAGGARPGAAVTAQATTPLGSSGHPERSISNQGAAPSSPTTCSPTDLRYFAVCGEGDRLLDQNRRFRDAAQGAGMELEYREAPGQHNFRFWNEWLPVALDRIVGQPK